MADSVTPIATAQDPSTLWRELLGQWEKASNDLANQAMKSSEFGRAMSQASNMTLAAQQSMGDAFAKMLVGLNLPSRSDVLGIGQQVQAIDARMARIEALLQQLTGGDAAPLRPAVAKPPRTRRPAGSKH